MAQYEHLPIYKKSMDLAVYVEQIVRVFSRYHKYSLGADLRQLSHSVLRLVIRANSQYQPQVRLDTLLKLRENLEELKVCMRLGKEIKAFNNVNTRFRSLLMQLLVAKLNLHFI